VEGGLVVPVVRDADQRSVTQISGEARELVGRARANKLKPEEFSGGTFTVSTSGCTASASSPR
jgi:pyruvate dehydrogenase E2 component (dihydrolipoamide acetyltransferase)